MRHFISLPNGTHSVRSQDLRKETLLQQERTAESKATPSTQEETFALIFQAAGIIQTDPAKIQGEKLLTLLNTWLRQDRTELEVTGSYRESHTLKVKFRDYPTVDFYIERKYASFRLISMDNQELPAKQYPKVKAAASHAIVKYNALHQASNKS